MANPYEYPPPTLPPPPPPPPAPAPPPVYTYPIPYPLPSNIPSPYQPVFPSPPQLYPPFPQPAFQFNLSAQPVAFYPSPPPNYHYGTFLLPQPQPQTYAYLRPFPYDPFSATDPVHSVGNEGLLPAQTSSSTSSLSIQPVNHLLHNIRFSDPPSLAPSPPSHRRNNSYDYHYQPSSDKPAGSPPPENPSGEEAIVPFAGSGAIVPFAGPGAIVPFAGPGAIVPFAGAGAIVPFAGPGAIVPFAGPEAIVPFSASGSEPESGAIVPYEGKPKGKTSLKVLLLHGSLDIWVHEAMNLPNMDLFHKTLGDMLGARITNSITGKVDQAPITSDPYVSIMLCDAAIGRTYVVSNSENPAWMQHFNVPVAHHAAEIEFVVKDSDVVGAQLIGSVYVPTEQIYSGEKVEGAFPILGTNGKQCKPGAFLRLSIQYIPMNRLSIYHHGGGTDPEYRGVPNTYFPLRKGGNVTLYQDAHVPDGCLPDLRMGNGMQYQHGKCWYDIFDAISNARRLIYIGGWSVYHTVRLVRDSGNSPSPILGDLLKLKSQEGVRVLLLVWDDPTSRSILGYRTDGVMGTRDEETRRFFKHSTVQVLLCPRSAGKKHSFVKQHETGTIYTHHQKQVVVDADAGNNRRKIVAFIGGLDLCGGRYDTPEHPIFRTLQTLHKDDYHNPNFVNYDESGPREPWHDMHCRIDGPAAFDVLQNFEERWLKAAKHHGIKKLKKSDDSLLSIDRIPDIIGIDDTIYRNDNDPETWHVQIFRSIDSNSAKGFPKDPSDASNKNLVCGKNVLIDMSIHQAYIHAIRAAQHFIYIENQYFLGSSFGWDSNKNLGANNLIPIEIAFKIASKIRANERFTAYIVIPMWPEGNPTGAPTQRILFWQIATPVLHMSND
ncbi:phospholipase D beta 1-like [Zingiber officinale]|uniref:phospholipase D beta 1-like n=1 Tax=Zingiber officinale TaxID=94328 RepID=UPI001C4CA5B3|nr:phospholipase D beta 1-like [Zingiber officinale]